MLYGGAGDDILYGDYGNDVLDGGAGNDYLLDGYGKDIYVFGKGYGHDVVHPTSYAGEPGVVRLKGLTADDVEFLLIKGDTYYHDLVIRIKETGETITVKRVVYNFNADSGH